MGPLSGAAPVAQEIALIQRSVDMEAPEPPEKTCKKANVTCAPALWTSANQGARGEIAEKSFLVPVPH
eukprot:3186521-Pyramimonas_sp.AAC.1